jgi:hypothetical protein
MLRDFETCSLIAIELLYSVSFVLKKLVESFLLLDIAAIKVKWLILTTSPQERRIVSEERK